MMRELSEMRGVLDTRSSLLFKDPAQERIFSTPQQTAHATCQCFFSLESLVLSLIVVKQKIVELRASTE